MDDIAQGHVERASAITRGPKASQFHWRIAGLVLLTAVSMPVVAQTIPGANMTAPGEMCMQDVAGFALNCNANDVAIAGVAKDPNGEYKLEILDGDGCAYPGDTVKFKAEFELVSNSKERHDVGVYFVEDGDPNGDGAISGSCSISTVPFDPDPPWLDLDGTSDPLPGTNTTSNLQDMCGDVSKDRNPMRPTIEVTATCVDPDKDGFLNLPYCLSWRQSGSNEYCDSPLDAYPGAPSKCKCDTSFNVPIAVPPAELKVVKTASPTSLSEPGGSVSYTVTVTNTGIDPSNPVTLTSLTDDKFGNVFSIGTCVPNSMTLQGDGGSVTCTFTETISGNAGDSHVNKVKADGIDSRNNSLSGDDTATVTFSPALPAIKVTKTANPTSVTETLTGTQVTFTVKIQNTSSASSDPVTISTLTDQVSPDEPSPGEVEDISSDVTCVDSSGVSTNLGQTIQPGDFISCQFTRTLGAAGVGFTDSSHVNRVTASGMDDDGAPVSDSDSATVTINDAQLKTAIKVDKTASTPLSNCPAGAGEPAPATCVNLFEPGGLATFTVVVTNTSTLDAITIDSLVDSIHGDLDNFPGCSLPQTILPGGKYSCSFTAQVTGNAGDSETDRICANGKDDDGVTLNEACDDATVNITDVAPSATLTKKATSAVVKYEVTVTNTSDAESLTITQLIDDRFGNIDKDFVEGSSYSGPVVSSTCDVPRGLAPATVDDGSDSYQCVFDALVQTTPHTNTVTATVVDDDAPSSVTPSDSATVTIEDAQPAAAD